MQTARFPGCSSGGRCLAIRLLVVHFTPKRLLENSQTAQITQSQARGNDWNREEMESTP